MVSRDSGLMSCDALSSPTVRSHPHEDMHNFPYASGSRILRMLLFERRNNSRNSLSSLFSASIRDGNREGEEYIRLEEEKARRHGRTFNWQIAIFGKVKNYKDEDDHPIDFETEFPAIVFDNTLTVIQSEPTKQYGVFNFIEYGVLHQFLPKVLNTNTPYSVEMIRHMAQLPAADQRHPWLRYQIEEYTEGIRHTEMRQDLEVRLRMVYSGEGQQLEAVRRRMTWRQFILALRLHTELGMAKAGFGAYWAGSDRLIPTRGILGIIGWRSRLTETSWAPPLLMGQPPKKVTGEEERGQAVRRALYWASSYAFWAERQQAAAPEANEGDQATEEVALEIPAPAQAPPPPPPAPQPRTMSQRIERIEGEVYDLRRDVLGLRGDVASFTTEQSKVSTWLISCMTQLMNSSGQTYYPFDSGVSGLVRAMLAPP
ncbi:hypothetical protein Tco_1352035 [Tanacetum coccineum]